jgi:hypothetical protein
MNFTDEQLDELAYSDEYMEYIMNNAGGQRVICNGDMLIDAVEDGFLFEEFLESIK